MMPKPPLLLHGKVPRVLGLDPAMGKTGVVWSGGIQTLSPPKHASSGMDRLNWLRSAVNTLVRVAAPQVVFLEGYSMGQARGSSQMHSTGEFGGVLRLTLWDAGVPYVEIAPGKLKKFATGSGKGGKEGIYAEAIRRLEYMGSSPDEADAYWLFAMGMAAYGAPIVQLPKAHMEALADVKLPEIVLHTEAEADRLVEQTNRDATDRFLHRGAPPFRRQHG